MRYPKKIGDTTPLIFDEAIETPTAGYEDEFARELNLDEEEE